MSSLQDIGGVAFELDGQPITARPGETILKAAQRHGVETMDTAAACRTFNILTGEGRNVIAALILESPPS